MSLIKDDLIKTVLLKQSLLGVAANGDEIQKDILFRCSNYLSCRLLM